MFDKVLLEFQLCRFMPHAQVGTSGAGYLRYVSTRRVNWYGLRDRDFSILCDCPAQVVSALRAHWTTMSYRSPKFLTQSQIFTYSSISMSLPYLSRLPLFRPRALCTDKVLWGKRNSHLTVSPKHGIMHISPESSPIAMGILLGDSCGEKHHWYNVTPA